MYKSSVKKLVGYEPGHKYINHKYDTLPIMLLKN